MPAKTVKKYLCIVTNLLVVILFGTSNILAEQLTQNIETFANASSSCCYFDTDDCGVTQVGWYWSEDIIPYDYYPAPTGNYLWTNDTEAQLTFPTVYTVTSETAVTFDYTFDSVYINVLIYFFPTGEPPLQVALINIMAGWAPFAFQCINCCNGKDICTGQFTLQVTGVGSFVGAIDNFEVDGSCHDSVGCCDFDNYAVCGYGSGYFDGYQWNNSRSALPQNPPISPGSDYAFFEAINYDSPSFLYTKLSTSNSPTVFHNGTFQGNFYVDIGNSNTANALQINFVSNNLEHQLGSIKDTGGVWKTFEFSCETVDCCGGQESCSGPIEINAYIEAHGGTVFYGVDAFSVDGNCN
ncbi:hypothetical protein CHUAL_008337 [Chamberlinius hualienensis]